MNGQEAGAPARVHGTRRARVALAHDWLCGMRGGEAVLERLARLVDAHFEAAGLYVMFDDGRALSPAVDAWRARGLVRASRLSSVPGAIRLRRWLLPAYPWAVEELSARLASDHASGPGVDVVVSTSSAAIKGLRTPEGVPHVCYCHSPARYAWFLREEYSRGGGVAGRLRAAGLAAWGPRFRRWDRETSGRVWRFVANSAHTQKQIAKCFGRDSEVVHPPVRTGVFTFEPAVPREEFWLSAGALEPYKRVDLAIEAARLAGARLLIAGDGSQRRALERRAGPHAVFLGRVSDDRLRDLMRRAALLVMPQLEDFGIVAVEALSCGCPVVARSSGGSADVVREGVNGALFSHAEPAAIAAACARCAGMRLDAGACAASARGFSEERFDAAMLGVINAALAHRRDRAAAGHPQAGAWG